MDNRPIGFFDSGIGGLTSIPYIMRELPNERIIFYGDTARTPYGSKSVGTIRDFAFQIADFLDSQNVKMMVIACNTITASALDALRERYSNIPIVGCISPTARKAARIFSPEDRPGLIATKATVRSGAYEQKIREYNPKLRICSKACPALVPLIEEGIIKSEIMDLTLKHYLDDFIKENDLNGLILGCTHYPLVAENIRRLYPDLKILSSSKEVAMAVKYELEKNDMLAGERSGENTFFASDLSDSFVNMIELILGQDKEELNIKFKNFEI